MSSPNVELTRRLLDAFNERNADAFGVLVTDDAEWVSATAVGIERRTYRGRDGVRQFFEEASIWDSIEARADDIRDLGDRALVLGRLRWAGNLEVTGPLALVLQFEEGKLKRIDSYRKTSDALAAVGLEE
jgi:ketosteroid isomerase-like protein